MSTNKWTSKYVINRLSNEMPALIEYAFQNFENYDGYSIEDAKKTGHPRLIKYIINKIILPEYEDYDILPRNAFDLMGVNRLDWLSLYKKSYEWLASKENLNEIIAYKML